MSNRLASETSPYLLQHKDNPVDWYPWGNEALQRAQQEDKPILVSIGYSACHWCHVMAHETFENAEIAALMNANFINIKVDREERPDIDAIYMTALQAMSGQGGWPLNVFLTPTAVPFFGGTYWPPTDRAGMPGFPKVIGAISNAWANNRENLEDSASKILGYLESSTAATPSGGSISPVIAETAIQNLRQQFDPEYGGIGRAPKFPQASVLEFLLRHIKRTGSSDAREMLELTLTRMAEGGIYDHLGGGFARYSVDAEWLVPHFEKMLYDNAQLVSVYTDSFRVTGNPLYQTVVEETVEWVVREMKSPVGGFYAALDADSEGHEGKFYVWSLAEIDTVLDPESADLIKLHYGVTEGGNFEGKSILHVTRPQAELAISLDRSPTDLQEVLESAKRALLKQRGTRIRPGTDTKIIVSWNALMIEALASAGMAFQQPDWIHEATVAADFIWANGFNQDGQLVRTLTEGQPKGEGMLEDHAFLAHAFIALYAATGEDRWLEQSRTLSGMIEQAFHQTSGPGFYDTSVTHEQLIIRPRELQDGAIPCGNSMALDALLTIGQLTEDSDSHDQVAAMMSALAGPMAEHPTAFGRFLAVLERLLANEQQLVLAGKRQSRELAALRQAYSESYEPFTVLAYAAETDASERWPTLGNRPLPDGATAAAYLCRGMSCLPPVTTSTDLGELLIQGTR